VQVQRVRNGNFDGLVRFFRVGHTGFS
jgi:hypothetical protein